MTGFNPAGQANPAVAREGSTYVVEGGVDWCDVEPENDFA